MKACHKNGINFIELSIAFDAITVVTNKSNRWLSLLTPSELFRLWSSESQGKVIRWNQVNLVFHPLPSSYVVLVEIQALMISSIKPLINPLQTLELIRTPAKMIILLLTV